MSTKNKKITLETFIKTLQNIYNKKATNLKPTIALDISTTLTEKSNHFIDASSDWITAKESPNKVTIHITDDMATTKIPVFAFIITEKHIHDKMVLDSVKVKQGKGINSDLDEIIVTYKYRIDLHSFYDQIEQEFLQELKNYK